MQHGQFKGKIMIKYIHNDKSKIIYLLEHFLSIEVGKESKGTKIEAEKGEKERKREFI